MNPLADARLAVSAARDAHENAQRAFNTAEVRAAFWRQPDGTFPDLTGGDPAVIAEVAALQPTLDLATTALANVTSALASAAQTYTVLAAESPLFAEANTSPLLLLPVRIEAVYGTDADGGPQLKIRVYPDDVHVDSHEPALTAREHDAGTAYWRRVSAADPSAADERARAWADLVAQTGRRAGWVHEVLTPTSGAGATAVFPEVDRREDAWTRAAQTLLLPDKLEFSAYRGGSLVWRHEGAEIPDTLPLGVAPVPGTNEAEIAEQDGIPFDPASRWLIDFDEAVRVGMGLAVTLEAAEDRFDVLTVVGLGHQDPATGARRVQDALRAHSFAAGLGTLPVGTPSNNTAETRSGWRTREDPADPDTTSRRQAAYDAASDQESARLARTLGIDGREVLAQTIEPESDSHQALLRQLHRLQADSYAWSPIWAPARDFSGRNEPIEHPRFTEAADHYTQHVRGRGPLPLLRVGRQPYGVLPVSAMSLWTIADPGDWLAAIIGSFHATLASYADRAPHFEEDFDQDAVLLELLSREASPRRIATWSDTFLGPDDRPPGSTFGAVPPTSALAWQQPFLRVDGEGMAIEPEWLGPFPDPFPQELRAFLDTRPLARLLVEFQLAIETMRATHTAPDPATFRAVVTPIEQTMWQVRHAPTRSLFYGQAMRVVDWISGVIASQPQLPAEVDQAVRSAENALPLLASYVDLEDEAVRDLTVVERLFRETLEPMSNRIDAWVTSLATRRLAALRAEAADGIRVGAYGWLEDVEANDPVPAREGYLLTPSLHHATTAAILRSGWQAHSKDRRSFAVDIQSARVRRALAVVDGVRAGQSVAALLGYQFERALHDQQLDRFVAGFRTAYPLAPLVDEEASDAKEARISIGARNVVDGQALRLDRAALTGNPDKLAGAAGSELREDADALVRLIGELDETFDAVGDLLLAESVHQLVGGSPLKAGVAADLAGRGQDLPADFDVLRTPRGGIALTHHVAVATAAAPSAGWADDRPLARLEPALEGWVRRRLGPTSQWQLGVNLGALDWCALDVLAAPADGLVRRLSALGEVDVQQVAALVDVCDLLRATLAISTPLLPGHVDPVAGTSAAGVDLDELDGRVRPWLRDVKEELGAAGTSEADERLERVAALGLPVRPGPAVEELTRLRTWIAGLELGELPPVPSDPAAAATWLQGVLALGGALLSPVVKLTVRLTVPPPSPPSPEPAEDEVADWWRDMTLVRPRVDSLDRALVASEALSGTPPARLAVTQPRRPDGEPGPWSATHSPDDSPHAQGSVVVVADSDGPWLQGLVVDSWSEVAPRPGGEEIAGVAFDFDRPGARAPQALLVAVPPDLTRGWCSEDVHACVEETRLLGRLRTLDLTDVPELSAVLPIPHGLT